LSAGLALSQVQNAADAGTPISTDSGVAPGSLAFVSYYASGAFTSDNATVSIRPVGSSTSIPAQVVNATPTGITFLVPPDAPLGTAQLIYKESGQLTQWTSISIIPSNFALYGIGSAPQNAVNVPATGPASPNGLANPAQPGEAVEIFGTGLGAIPGSGPQITLGGVSQTVLYAGTPGEPGVFQINFQIAAGTPDGCYVPLSVTWGTSTATSFLSKTSDGLPCHHPFQLSTAAMKALDNGGSLETGIISMTTALNAASSAKASRQESVSILFLPLTASTMANYFTASSMQGCGTTTGAGEIFDVLSGGVQFGSTMTFQSAATTLTLTSPNPSFEYSTVIPPSADAPLNNLPPPVIGGGNWTWSSSGGPDLPASSFSFNLAPPIQINGGAPVSIQSGQDQAIIWHASSYDSGATLQLSLSAQNFGPPSIVCYAPAQTGIFTIPGKMLTQFTPGGVGTLSLSVTESGASIPHANFNLSDGAPLLMLVNRGSTDTRPVDFK